MFDIREVLGRIKPSLMNSPSTRVVHLSIAIDDCPGGGTGGGTGGGPGKLSKGDRTPYQKVNDTIEEQKHGHV